MSKKKASAGNTMTLKDFHGGSIPSDLPLPSAPGVVVRSSEWSGYDRPNSWGGPMGRPDHRARPNSSPATRHFDDNTPFLSHTALIGRNFDEDERKPLDGGYTPRRTISGDSFRAVPSRVELRPEPLSSGKISGSATVSQASRSYSGRVREGACVGANSGGKTDTINVWAARKELALGVSELAWSEVSAVSKLANASALEKVSSGRWQSKHSIQHQVEVEVIEHLEFENRIDPVMGGEYSGATLARHMERGLALADVNHGRIKASSYSPLKENSLSTHAERVKPFHADVRISGSQMQAAVHSETSERPKVKLLPRTKPLEELDAPVDPKQGYQQLNDSVNGYAGTNELHGNNNAAKSSSVALESENQVMERPKLNLKPRSQPIEQLVENREMERVGLFGGARPREVVLKERGVDGAPITNHESVQQPERVKHNVQKTERGPDHAIPGRHGERTDNNMGMDPRTGKNFENERADNKQRRNRRNQNMERPRSPETWRKPVEQSKPASPDTGCSRRGKVASALELAQVFSKSFSDPKQADRYSGQRGGLHGNSQVPFSRLTSPTPRPQINGY